jgi:hypothetical protein
MAMSTANESCKAWGAGHDRPERGPDDGIDTLFPRTRADAALQPAKAWR